MTTGASFASRRHSCRRTVPGLAAALLFSALASSGPGLAQSSPEFDVAFSAYAVIPDAPEPPAGAVDLAAVAPASEEAIKGGMASWYGPDFRGRRTASGETFDPDQLTAAHRTLPFGSMVRVTYLTSGRSVVVRINDRGPFTGGRVIDLSQAAAREIGLIGAGHGEVSLALLAD
ncbi:MAG TPA: septal ring lytic transglycosylase RlpA family protein [Sphingomonadaceae bacterium]|nr:septal ring lytic transglycosylase RlpA family protein [Sphingomonadaceae bacterium]